MAFPSFIPNKIELLPAALVNLAPLPGLSSILWISEPIVIDFNGRVLPSLESRGYIILPEVTESVAKI